MNPLDDPEWAAQVRHVLEAVIVERAVQAARWGVQDHPSVDPALSYGIPTELRAKAACDMAGQAGVLTWAHIAVEELAEAVDAVDEVARREELVQLGAVVVAWIESIDRRVAPK